MREDWIEGIALFRISAVAAIDRKELYKNYKDKHSFDKLSIEFELNYLRTMCENEISSYEYVLNIPGLSTEIIGEKLAIVRDVVSLYNHKLEFYNNKYPDVTDKFKSFVEVIDESTGFARFGKEDALDYVTGSND